MSSSHPEHGETSVTSSDRRLRLETAFGVNAERWLCATVQDLRTPRVLMQETPVVRLL